MGKKTSKKTEAPQIPVKRWNAFTCPDCRGIFRVPHEYQGLAVVCPLCDRMLRLPKAGEAAVNGAEQAAMPYTSQMPSPQRTRSVSSVGAVRSGSTPRSGVIPSYKNLELPVTPVFHSEIVAPTVKHQRPTANHEEWNRSTKRKTTRHSRHGGFYTRYRYFLLSFVALGVIFLSAFLIKTLTSPDRNDAEKGMAPIVAISPLIPELPNDPKPATKEISSQEVEAVVKQFMEAKTVEEMKQHVFLDDALDQKINAYHVGDPWQRPGFSSIFEDQSTFSADGSIYQTKAADRNFEECDLFLRIKDRTCKVDWESWVAWGEMTVDELRTRKPNKPVEVRVLVSNETYYNFDFPKEKESEWVSYKLTFPREEEILHAYVPRGSKLEDAMRLNVDEQRRYMILRIRFPEKAASDSQVLVDSVVQEGWVRP